MKIVKNDAKSLQTKHENNHKILKSTKNDEQITGKMTKKTQNEKHASDENLK